jgi:hypothetical protein
MQDDNPQRAVWPCFLHTIKWVASTHARPLECVHAAWWPVVLAIVVQGTSNPLHEALCMATATARHHNRVGQWAGHPVQTPCITRFDTPASHQSHCTQSPLCDISCLAQPFHCTSLHQNIGLSAQRNDPGKACTTGTGRCASCRREENAGRSGQQEEELRAHHRHSVGAPLNTTAPGL